MGVAGRAMDQDAIVLQADEVVLTTAYSTVNLNLIRYLCFDLHTLDVPNLDVIQAFCHHKHE